MRPLIIGFSGRKGAGKDTCAAAMMRRLERNYPQLTVRYFAFGNYLKIICQDLFGLTETQCWGTNEDKDTPTALRWEDFPIPPEEKPRQAGPMTAREVLQYFGTNIVRRLNPDAWVRYLIEDHIPDSHVDVALIVDGRFPNETDGVLAAGGKVIRLTRTPYPEDHALSEIALDQKVYDWCRFSLVLDNAHLSIQQTNTRLWSYVNTWVHDACNPRLLSRPRKTTTPT
jgi:hypothetical protein